MTLLTKVQAKQITFGYNTAKYDLAAMYSHHTCISFKNHSINWKHVLVYFRQIFMFNKL